MDNFASTTAVSPSEHLPPRRTPGALRRLGLGLCLFTTLGVGALRAQVSKEYQLKAAFLYNFTKFVEWPTARFADASAPIVIGVIGSNPFGRELESVVRDRKVGGRDIAIVNFTTAEDAKAAHAVFIVAGEEKRIAEELGALLRVGVLVVGETEQMAALGSTVIFKTVDDKVRFEINLAAAERGRLKISAQLLKLAVVVRRKD